MLEKLLEKDNSVSIRHINLQSHAIKKHEIRNGVSPILTEKLFMPNNEHPYNFRHSRQFKTVSKYSVLWHRKFLFLGPKILPASFKKQECVEAFKRAIKAWKPGNCLCRLCSVYVQTLVFYEQS